MRLSKLLMPTLKEVPAEAEITSHQLMMRGAFIRKLAAGIYSYLPLGLRSLKKVESIIREEMDSAGAQGLLMSALLPSDYYIRSNRWDVFGPEMFKLQDRNSRDFCLGPTHEEIFTDTVRREVHSYKQLPQTLYQIQTKYRDERRPRFGVMRSREFIMKDAYSFDIDTAGLDTSYKEMHGAYCRIFDRMGLDYIVVEADSGAMGGSGSQEFMVKSHVGEDVIAHCAACGYAANDEKAECVPDKTVFEDTGLPAEKVKTPDVHTIEELVEFMGTSPKMFAKTLIYKADDRLVAVMVRGDREVNEVKLQNFLGADTLEMADAHSVREVTGAEVGFAGPVGLSIDVYADSEIANMKSFITGANQTEYHLKNINLGRDFTPKAFADLRTITKGDLCCKCGAPIETSHGIEVGHIFKLGTKYSKSMGLSFPIEGEGDVPVVMGCYGIGVNRCLAAVIEQSHDENGIIWPVSLAPYHVTVITVNTADKVQTKLSEEIYNKLKTAGVEVLIDDRDERPGVKFKDADLIGIPVRITVGKKAGEGIVEYKLRTEKTYIEVSADKATENAVSYIKKELCQ